MTNITVNEKTDINPIGFTYTPTEFYDWVTDVAKVIKKTFEPFGLDNVVLYFFNYRVDSRSNKNIKEEFQCLNLLYTLSKEAEQRYDFNETVDITLMAVDKTVLEFPKQDCHNGATLECYVYDMVDALHFFNMLQMAIPVQLDQNIVNETNEDCCQPFDGNQTNGKIWFDFINSRQKE
ncbi:hypothetical protein [Moraxella bovis]|uniref:Uncharacterized protein n=2 Tax=Moraxella bovis TaxID=476 RepID=Q5KT70_MORBO|nr:hypothetical protein [Moraxella bovis]AWY21821.1 hypothetical protein DQF64_14685 [Moraxella bovis]OOR90553.1 hypothetical protein B0182_04985 [Moraxella bovis]BAD83757.1 hypothetical protein [Moraxella bovis Epp63]